MKIYALIIILLLSLYAQPAHQEQALGTSGGTSVATNGQWAVVGDATNNKVHVYPMDYASFVWDVANKIELAGPKTGAFGTSVAIDGANIVVGAPEVETWRMEANTIVIGNTYDNPTFTTITLQRTYEQPPLIFALATDTGGNPSAAKIRSRSNNSFEIVHAEPMNHDGPHVAMTIAYFAIERGDHILPDGTRIYAGEINTRRQRRSSASGDITGWETITFPRAFNAQPMVLAEIQTMNNEVNNVPSQPSEPWLTAAVQNVGTTSIELTLDRSEVLTATPVSQNETIAFLVMDQKADSFTDINSVTVDFDSIYSTNTIVGWDNGCTTISFNQGFTSNPLVVATKNTLNGGDGGWLRRCSLSTAGVGFVVDEDQYQDSERGHIQERAGVLAFSQAFEATFKVGEAYLYGWNSINGWQLQETIEPITWGDDMKFGTSVGISKSSVTPSTYNIAVGAPLGLNSAGNQNGIVYAYSWDGTVLSSIGTSQGDLALSKRFGQSLDLKGDYMIVGAPDENSSSGVADLAGASYTFKYNVNVWNEYPSFTDFRIKTGTANTRLGVSVAIDKYGKTALISTNPSSNDGSYQYENDGSSAWLQKIHYPNEAGGVDIDENVSMVAEVLDIYIKKNEVNTTISTSYDHMTISPTVTTNGLKSMSLHKNEMLVNDPDNTQAVAIDVPCGIKPTFLKADEWAIVSVPCGDGSSSIGQLFTGQLGASYGDAGNWVMYKQSLGYSGHQSDYEIMDINDAMDQGVGYWVITDSDRYLEVHYASASQRTVLTRVTPTLTDVAGLYDALLPPLVNGTEKKIMMGNPFPRIFKWIDMELGTGAATFIPFNTQTDYHQTGYVYDIKQSGQPYRAITATGTPGISDEIKPFEGFWIKDLGSVDATGRTLGIPFER